MGAINVSKVRAAIEAAKKEVSVLYKETVVAGEKDPTILNGLQSVGKVNIALDKALDRLDIAVEKTTPKPKEEKKDKKTDGKK